MGDKKLQCLILFSSFRNQTILNELIGCHFAAMTFMDSKQLSLVQHPCICHLQASEVVLFHLCQLKRGVVV